MSVTISIVVQAVLFQLLVPAERGSQNAELIMDFDKPSMDEVKVARAEHLVTPFENWNNANRKCFQDTSKIDGECKEESKIATRKLFDETNAKLVAWEAPDNTDPLLRCPGEPKAFHLGVWPEGVTKPDVSIVYGGMPQAHGIPNGSWEHGAYESMPSALIAALQQLSGRQVISLSRRAAEATSPHQHIELGQEGLLKEDVLLPEDVLQGLQGKTVHVYMTYANHAPQPEVSIQNIKVAQNVAADLQKIKAVAKSVHVVLTGTDATNHPGDDSRKYKVMGGNFHYAMSKLAQAYVLENALTPSVAAQAAIENIQIALGSLGNASVQGTGAQLLTQNIPGVLEKVQVETSAGAETAGAKISADAFAKHICAAYQGFDDKQAYGFRSTSIIQIGVILTNLHVPRKAMNSAQEFEASPVYKGTKWVTGVLPVLVSPQYAAYKHITATTGLIREA